MPDEILRTRNENRRRRCSLLVLPSHPDGHKCSFNGPKFAGPGVGLRGFFQPVYPPIAHSAIFPQLDCFQALGDKNAIR